MTTSFNRVETKWNADEEKLRIVMDIETSLESAFLSYDLEAIYNLLRAYRRHTRPKFNAVEQKEIDNAMNDLTTSLQEYNRNKNEELKIKFYLGAEDLFLKISQNVKNLEFIIGKEKMQVMLYYKNTNGRPKREILL